MDKIENFSEDEKSLFIQNKALQVFMANFFLRKRYEENLL